MNYAHYKFDRNRKPISAWLPIVGVSSLVSLLAFGNQELWGSIALTAPSVWSGEWWRLLSVSLVHGDAMHLLMNMYFIFVIGTMYEPMVGRVWFVVVYLLSVLGGSSLALLTSHALVPMVGASGGAFGLLGACLTHVYARWRSWSMIFAHPMTKQLVIVLIINMIFTFSIPGISIAGHVGGLVVGGFAGFLVSLHLARSLHSGERIAAQLFPLMMLIFVGYSLMPVHRGAWKLVQAENTANDVVREFFGRRLSAEEVQEAIATLTRACEYWRGSDRDIQADERYFKVRDAVAKDLSAIARELGVPELMPAPDTPVPVTPEPPSPATPEPVSPEPASELPAGEAPAASPEAPATSGNQDAS